MRILLLCTLSLLWICGPAAAQNHLERRQNRREIRLGKAQIQQDKEEIEAFESLLQEYTIQLRQGNERRWGEAHRYVLNTMQREIDQGWQKYSMARFETELSTEEVRSERREMVRNRLDKVLTTHDRRDDRRDIRQDRRDIRDDKRDRRDDRRDQEAIRNRTQLAERIYREYQALTRTGIPQRNSQRELEQILTGFLELMEADLVATKRELREDRRERGEDRRERRDDRRERREIFTGG